jgi:hypothetical protein
MVKAVAVKSSPQDVEVNPSHLPVSDCEVNLFVRI